MYLIIESFSAETSNSSEIINLSYCKLVFILGTMFSSSISFIQSDVLTNEMQQAFYLHLYLVHLVD